MVGSSVGRTDSISVLLFIPGLFQESACFQLSFIMHLLARLLFVLWNMTDTEVGAWRIFWR